MATPSFRNRDDAGRQLAAGLARFGSGHRGDVVVLGLPRGGVPVAAQVAAALHAPLDVLIVRKLGVPFSPEVAMGAIGEGGARLLDTALIRRLRIPSADVEAVERRERAILDARVASLRAGQGAPDLVGRTALLVDDGIATGATASVACQVARLLGAQRVVVAAPVGGPDAVVQVRGADEVICLEQPAGFSAVGAYYRDFSPTPESEVRLLLDQARRLRGPEG